MDYKGREGENGSEVLFVYSFVEEEKKGSKDSFELGIEPRNKLRQLSPCLHCLQNSAACSSLLSLAINTSAHSSFLAVNNLILFTIPSENIKRL